MASKRKHGGIRVGAGRKPLPKGKVREGLIVLRVTEAERNKVKQEAERRGVTVTELLIGPWREK